MAKIALVIARSDSTRLPNKHNRKIGDLTMMDWIILRLKNVVDDIVICTTTKGLHNFQKYIDERVSVIAPEADDNNVVSRIRKTAEIFRAKYYLIVSGDCPLISTPIMKDLLHNLMVNRKYDACMLSDGTSHLGVDAINIEGIQKLGNGEHFSLNLAPSLNIFRLMTLPNIYANFRATVDNHADLAFMRECQRQLGDAFTFEGVSELVHKSPSINKINGHVEQKAINLNIKHPNVAFITRGDCNIGVGHIARCIALAQHFNESEHKHIHFFVNNVPLVKGMMKKYGYEYGLDYSYGHPVIEEEQFKNWEFIKDVPGDTTYDYDKMYRIDPTFAVDKRLSYVKKAIESDVIVSFGKGDHVKYGRKIMSILPTCKKHLMVDIKNLPSFLLGAKRIITVWSQTAREAIFLGKVPEVYSVNESDHKLCKYLDKQGVLKWKGNLYKEWSGV